MGVFPNLQVKEYRDFLIKWDWSPIPTIAILAVLSLGNSLEMREDFCCMFEDGKEEFDHRMDPLEKLN